MNIQRTYLILRLLIYDLSIYFNLDLEYYLVRSVVPGGARGAIALHSQILTDQLTLSQPRGAEYAHQIVLTSPNFQTFRRPCLVKTINTVR